MFILDLKESVEDKSDSLLKFGKNSPVEWFKYRSQRREFTVLPFQDADRDALTRLNNIKRLRFLRQPADAADPQLSRVEFICGLPYNISVRVLCQFVAELLCVSQFEIVLYLAQTNLQLYESQPLTVLIEESLYSFIQEGKYNNTATAKYSLFYRLLPFPLGNLGHDNYHYEDLRSRFVYADIRLVDVRIRSLRAEFFKKLHFLAKQRLESAGDPAAKKPRFEDGSESCASLIDEYDISYDIAEELVLLLKSNNSESLTDIGAILQTSDINRLFVRFPMREKVMNCMDKLRSMIDADAIEMNADWMRILSKPIGRQSNSRKVVVQENLVQESIILSSTEFLVNYCNELESTYCVVSDKLIVQETDNPGVVSPSFPLALMEVPHHRIIAKVVPNYLESKALRDTW